METTMEKIYFIPDDSVPEIIKGDIDNIYDFFKKNDFPKNILIIPLRFSREMDLIGKIVIVDNGLFGSEWSFFWDMAEKYPNTFFAFFSRMNAIITDYYEWEEERKRNVNFPANIIKLIELKEYL